MRNSSLHIECGISPLKQAWTGISVYNFDPRESKLGINSRSFDRS
jgi:hypothetical protein